MKIRNSHARLCEKYLKATSPETHKTLLEAAEENYTSGHPLYTLGYVFERVLAKIRALPEVDGL